MRIGSHTPEKTKEKLRIAARKQFTDPAQRELRRIRMTGDQNPAKRKEVCEKIRATCKQVMSTFVMRELISRRTKEALKNVDMSAVVRKMFKDHPEINDKIRKKLLGRKLTEMHKNNIGKSNLGKTHSQKTKDLIRKSNLGKKHSQKTKDKQSAAKKGNTYMLGKHHSQKTKDIIRQKRLLQILPTKDTRIEIALQDELVDRNITFKKHVSLIGQPDIFIEPNICIFADGCYWHKCKKCGSAIDDIRENKDIHVSDVLTQKGYVVLRFWEHDITKSIITCVNKIQSIL